MKWSDVLSTPLKHFKISNHLVWILYGLLTIIPGTILWLVTLGAFRYFHLSNMYCTYLVDKDLKKKGDYDF